jgi:hypothetical protein
LFYATASTDSQTGRVRDRVQAPAPHDFCGSLIGRIPIQSIRRLARVAVSTVWI